MLRSDDPTAPRPPCLPTAVAGVPARAKWYRLVGLGTVILVRMFGGSRGGWMDRRQAWTRFGRWIAATLALCIGLVLAHADAAPPPPPPVKSKPTATATPPSTPATKPPATAPAKPATTTPAKPATTPAKPAAAPAKPAATTPTKPPATAGTKPPPAAPATGTEPPPDVAARQSEIYGDRIDGLQVDVDDLKDRIFRSKARLALLRETVLKGVMAGSRVVIAHRNLMGSGFRLVRMVYIMDGAQIYARTDESGGLDSEDELVIYDGNLPPGPHNVTIELTYKGHGYGVFAYLTGYTFDSRSSHSFTAPENGAVKLSSVGYERGNLTTEMKDRPSVNWQELPLDAAGRPLAPSRTRRKVEE